MSWRLELVHGDGTVDPKELKMVRCPAWSMPYSGEDIGMLECASWPISHAGQVLKSLGEKLEDEEVCAAGPLLLRVVFFHNRHLRACV